MRLNHKLCLLIMLIITVITILGTEVLADGVTKPPATTISVDKSTYSLGDTVNITWVKVNAATSYDIHVHKDGERIKIISGLTGSTYKYEPEKAGSYSFHIYTVNSAGYTGGTSASCAVKESTVNLPSATTISVDKSTYSLGDTVNITWVKVNAATSYDIHVHKDGERIKIISGLTGSTYKYEPEKAGSYSFHIYTVNSAGYTGGTSASCAVKESTVNLPSATTISVDKSTYSLGDTVNITWVKVNAATSYDIHVHKDGERIKIISGLTGSTYKYEPEKAGLYSFHIYTVNSEGYTGGTSASCAVKESTVNLPSATTISVDKSTYSLGDTVNITWVKVNAATSYDIHVHKDGERIKIISGLTGSTYKYEPEKAGLYSFHIYTVNSAGYTGGTSASCAVKTGSENIDTLEAVNEYNLSNSSYIIYNNKKYYIQVPGYSRDNSDYLDGGKWTEVKSFSKVVTSSLDWKSFLSEYDIYDDTSSTSTTDAAFSVSNFFVSLFNYISSTRVSVSFQTNGTENRAIVRTNVEVINLDGYINNKFSMLNLYRRNKYPYFHYIKWYKKKEADEYIDQRIRSEFNYSFSKEDTYDILISLSKKHKNDIYSSYVGYNSSDELALYPIIYLDDKIYIFKNGKRSDVFITINDYFMGVIPFPQEYLYEICNSIP